jgi:hypothetical protein
MKQITIKTIECAGGACPYQVDGITDDGKYFYLRYRGGRLRAGVADSYQSFWNNPSPYNVIDISHGGPLDGWPVHEELYPILSDKIKFPDEFRICYNSIP